MAKRLKKREKAEATSDTPEPFNNALAHLGSMGLQLPSAPLEPDQASDAPIENESNSSYHFSGKLIIRHQRKGRGGKTATLLEGLTISPDERKALAKELVSVRTFLCIRLYKMCT